MEESGVLYLVSTPIGNYGDITFRAVEVLKSVDTIACEDTRKTGLLLKYFEITPKELISYHDHNEEKRSEILLSMLSEGNNIAVVSDAGTPCISDPGFRIVRSARENGFKITGIPGANAALNALVISGLPTDSFVFIGFLPHKKGRKTKIEEIASEKRTVVLYESVHRIIKTVTQLNEFLSDRKICVLREMTKTFEEHICGYPGEVLENLQNSTVKGEFVIVIEGKGKRKKNE